MKRINNFENGLDDDSKTCMDFIKKSTIEIKTPALDEIKNIFLSNGQTATGIIIRKV